MKSIPKAELRAGAMAISKAEGFVYSGSDILKSENPRSAMFVSMAKAVLIAAQLERDKKAHRGLADKPEGSGE